MSLSNIEKIQQQAIEAYAESAHDSDPLYLLDLDEDLAAITKELEGYETSGSISNMQGFKANLKKQHLNIIRIMLLNPRLSQEEVANVLEISPLNMSILTRSDSFNAIYNHYKSISYTQALERIQEKTRGLLETGLKAIADRFYAPTTSLREINESVKMLFETNGLINKGLLNTTTTNVKNVRKNTVTLEASFVRSIAKKIGRGEVVDENTTGTNMRQTTVVEERTEEEIHTSTEIGIEVREELSNTIEEDIAREAEEIQQCLFNSPEAMDKILSSEVSELEVGRDRLLVDRCDEEEDTSYRNKIETYLQSGDADAGKISTPITDFISGI